MKSNFDEDSLEELIKNYLKKLPKGLHVSSKEIYNEVKKSYPLISIHRTNAMLKKLKLSSNLSSLYNKKTKFELNVDHHHHLICMNCDSITEFTDDFLLDFGKSVSNKKKYFFVNSRFDIYGYCETCKQSFSNESIIAIKEDINILKNNFTQLVSQIETCKKSIDAQNIEDCISELKNLYTKYYEIQTSLSFIIDSLELLNKT